MTQANFKVKFHNPPNKLREKVGFGGIDMTRIERAESFIDENDLDFNPYAETLMHKLENIIKDIKSGTLSAEDGRKALIGTIMEIKANGGMFKYTLLSEIAGVILNFLESIDTINDDGMNIIDAHQNAIKVIITNRLTGDGGKEGRALSMELYAACNRYFDKYKPQTKK